MKLPFRLSPALVIAIFAVGIVIGERWASSFASSRGGVQPQPSTSATSESLPSADAASEGNKLPKPAAPTAAEIAAQRREALLKSLRSKLHASNVVPGEALLTFRSAEARERFARQAAAYGLQVLGDIPQLNALRVRYGQLESLRDALAENSGDYANVEGNVWLSIPPAQPQPQTDPANEGGRAPFGQGMMNSINAAGDRTHWGDHITVAVLDTGVLSHPTFGQGQVIHLDLVNDGEAFNSHGTSVASLIGGQNPQAPGVAPAAQILDIRVANADGYSVSSTLAEGIITATDRGAQVLNISLGGYGDSALLRQAVNYALQRGVVVVAAAGNDAYGQLAIPAAYERVISVGSVDANNRQAYFSNSGAGLDIAAPGVGVISAWDTDKVALVSGTSQSSALVSAAAASYLGWGVPPIAITARLKADARPGTAGNDSGGGVGTLMIRPPARR